MNNIDNKQMLETIPEYVKSVAAILASQGFEAYLVGGAVRDIFLNRTPKDYDIATNALPEEMEKLFDKCITTNARFGTVLVLSEGFKGEKFSVEVTTYRKEEEYFGGRWPGKVEFTSDLVADLSRRDFTINAMALDLTGGGEAGIIDPFGGRADLSSGIVKAVRDPLERFGEDGLRAYKACRMASELGFKLEDATFDAIGKSLTVASQISMERIRDEFVKCLYNSPVPSVGIELMRHSGLLQIFLPELINNIGVTQPEYHEDDVYTHSLKVLDRAEDTVKLAGLLHDIGKYQTKVIGPDGNTHFYGHDQKSADMAAQIMKRLKFSNVEIDRVTKLIRFHMFYYPTAEWRKSNDIEDVMVGDTPNSGGWTDAAIRRFISRIGEDLIEDLFKLRIADAEANPKSSFNPKEILALQNRISIVKEQDMALKISDLAIDGKDLQGIGYEPGPRMGVVLNKLLEIVIEDPQLNNKDELLTLAGQFKKD